MIIDHATRLHFQCSFTLRAATSVDEPWTELIKSVRHWISKAPRNCPPTTNDAFYSAWFFSGGEWRGTGGNYHYLKSARVTGEGEEREPQHWAIRYEHNCDSPGRVWRIDAGVTRLDHCVYRLSLMTSHYMRAGFIGREPPSPMPTAPNLVAWLLQSEKWEAFAGSERLHAKPLVLRSGEGEALRVRLADPNRECPIIIIAREFSSGQPLIDALRLSKLLGGSASVYESESSDLDKELEWCLGRRFSCWNGMVRVYQPGLRFDDPATPKRQRYFSSRDIKQHGHDAVVDMLVHGVARRAQRRPSDVVASIEDVHAIERENRMALLKETATDHNEEEWVELLEETNAKLEEDVKSQDQRIRQLQADLADRDDQIDRLEFNKKSIIAKTSASSKELRALRQQLSVLSELSELPESMPDVVALIERLQPSRIAFTEQAKKSVGECHSCRIADAWRCFWAMATTLHEYFFGEGARPGNIEKAFFDTTGFYLAMTEGTLTKANSKLMSLRQDNFQGQEIDITPHVRFSHFKQPQRGRM